MSDVEAQRDRLWGRDLWLDARVAGADTITTPSGDLAVVGGEEALRQALIRRVVTNPGDWALLPNYGVGARRYVKARNTRAMRDELAERVRSQFLAEPRVERIERVTISTTEDGLGIHVLAVVIPVGRLRTEGAQGSPLTISVEVR